MVPMTSGMAPNLAIDVGEKFAWMQWVAALVWGGDTRKQNHALATFAAKLIATLRDVPDQRPRPGDLHELANKMGISPGEIARMPGSRHFFSSYFSEPLQNLRAVVRTIFEPAGSIRAVADAPGRDRLLHDYKQALEGGAFLARAQLWYVAILHQCYPDIPASLNRAGAILAGLFDPWSDESAYRADPDGGVEDMGSRRSPMGCSDRQQPTQQVSRRFGKRGGTGGAGQSA